MVWGFWRVDHVTEVTVMSKDATKGKKAVKSASARATDALRKRAAQEGKMVYTIDRFGCVQFLRK